MQLKWRLSHIRGYLELGMVEAAAAEFSKIDIGLHGDSEVLKVSLCLFHEQEDWEATRRVAAQLCQREPSIPAWWITFAYATRRAENLEAAEAILLVAVKLHPNEPTIQFNLGCYACQRGDLVMAKAYVARAIALDAQFLTTAKNDPDLKALQDTDLFS
jgi:Flp pilus assembly protein TadD